MKKSVILFIALVLSVFALTGCSNTNENVKKTALKTDKVETVKVGVIAPISGPGATYGEDVVNVYQDAVEEFNSGSQNVKIKLIVEDGKCEGKSAVSAVQKLINVDKVDVILGGVCSSETMAAGPIANSKKITMLSAISSSPEISKIGEYVFRFWNDAHASITLAKYLNKRYQKIALISENTDYAQALAKKLKEMFKGQIVINERFNSDEKDFNIITNNLKQKQNDFDAIVILTQSDATTASLVKSLNANGLLNKFKGKIVGAYLMSSDAFLKEVGDLANGLIEVNIDKSVTPKGQAFLNEFRKKHTIKSTDTFLPLTKESVDLLEDAILDGARKSDDFKNYFQKITKQNPRNGYFGQYYFDENGDAIGLKYIMQKIENGKPILLKD